MIAADTSTWVAFLEGGAGGDAHLLDKALEDRQVAMVPVVLTELLSDPKLPSCVAKALSEVPLIEIEAGYWQRAGVLRAKVLARRRKARLGDALIHPELYRRRHSSPHAGPGLPSVRRNSEPRSHSWSGLTGMTKESRVKEAVATLYIWRRAKPKMGKDLLPWQVRHRAISI